MQGRLGKNLISTRGIASKESPVDSGDYDFLIRVDLLSTGLLLLSVGRVHTLWLACDWFDSCQLRQICARP